MGDEKVLVQLRVIDSKQVSVIYLISYLASHFILTVIPIVIAVAIFLLIHYSVRFSLDNSARSVEARAAIMAVIRGPVLVTVIGYAVGIVGYLNPSLLPSYLDESTLLFIIELLILLTSINAARRISKFFLDKFFRKRGASRRLLLFGVYSLGLVTLFYIVLTSPIRSDIQNGLLPAVGFITGVIISYFIGYIVNLLILRYQALIREKQPQFNTAITFGRRIIVGIVMLVGVSVTAFAAFPGASGAVASLLVAAGFTSIVVGLAAQSSLANLIAGMVIASSQPFRVGDALSYANEWARVEDIKLTFTVLRTWDNRRLVVPNQMFLNSTMINYDLGDASKLCVVYVTITFESDMDKAISILKDIAREHPDFVPDTNLPSVLVMGFTDGQYLDGVNLRLLSKAKDQSTNFQMSKEILYEIKKRFDANGIDMAYPRRQIVMDPNARSSVSPYTTGDPDRSNPKGTSSADSDHDHGTK